MDNLDKVRDILSETLGLGERKYSITTESNLLGSIPELDSMGVVSVITALESILTSRLTTMKLVLRPSRLWEVLFLLLSRN